MINFFFINNALSSRMILYFINLHNNEPHLKQPLINKRDFITDEFKNSFRSPTWLDYFIVRILKSRVRAGEILLTRGNGNFLATGFLIWNKFPFFLLTAVRLDLSGSGFLTLTFLDDLNLDFGIVYHLIKETIKINSNPRQYLFKEKMTSPLHCIILFDR